MSNININRYNLRNPNLLLGMAIAVGIVLITVLTWENYLFARQNPGGNDFLVHWMGTRNYIMNGISPYSDQTAIAIQTAAYGRPAQAGEHELRVAYPLYSMLVFAPFAVIADYNLARALWMTVLEISLFAISLTALRITGWKPGLLTLVLFSIFSIFWYHGLRPLINGNAVILITLMVVAGLYAIKNHNDKLAGVLFAFSTIKPQLTLIFLAYILLWCIQQKRWKVAVWMILTTLILTLAAMLLVPDWILQNLREVMRYPGYNPPGTLASALLAVMPGLGKNLPIFVAGILGIILLAQWFVSRHRADYPTFLWTACFTLVISQWIGIQTDPGNFIILMPVLVLTFSLLESKWRWGRLFSRLLLIFLFVFLWLLFLQTAVPGYQLQQSPVMFFPLPAILLILLLLVRDKQVLPFLLPKAEQ
jgi:hypothetical protein